jgi:ribosomal protein S18 acetylase RimI-like enzyme
MKIDTKILTPQTLAASAQFVELIAAAQRIEGARCIHSDFEITAHGYSSEDAKDIAYAVASEGAVTSRKHLVIIGADVDDDLKRAWLRGPFAGSNFADHTVCADAAFDALLVHTGDRARVWDAYIETTHDAALAWYLSRGFLKRKRNSVFVLKPNERIAHEFVRAPTVTIPESSGTVDAVARLASEAFPGGYLTRKNFAAPPSDEAVTLVVCEGNTLLGYVYASYESGAVEATIDNLAVTENARRKGIGKTLLRAALHWAITERNAPAVALVVTEGNAKAMQLYESVGFRLLAEGLHLRLEIEAP